MVSALAKRLVLRGGRFSLAAVFALGAAACYTSTPAPQPPGDHDAVPAPQPPGDHAAVPASEREREVTPVENTTFTPPPDRDELATPPPDPEVVARTAKVFGTVIDARGNRLAHVSVHIHSKGKVIDTRTNERGDYEVELEPGSYAITVDHGTPRMLRHVRLAPGQVKDVHFIEAHQRMPQPCCRP